MRKLKKKKSVLCPHSGTGGCIVEFSLSRDFVYPLQPSTFLEELLISFFDVLMPTVMQTVYYYFKIFELDCIE